AWAAGPVRVYGRLAEVLVDSSPVPLTGRLALDVGSGTGAATRALQGRGARVVAADAAAGMIATGPAPGVVADARRLPFADGTFGAVVAAFCLNHVDPPAQGLREMRRVACGGGAVLVSSYGGDLDHPVKDAVMAALVDAGYSLPPWYDAIQAGPAEALSNAGGMSAAARAAGLPADTDEVDVPFPELGAADLVAWRLGMAHIAPFVADLDPVQRHAVTERALGLLGDPPTLVRRIVVLTVVV
ncbi:MAG: class I SAM-dependent methyltransferase, partial [Jiangellaceae bacterium]